MWRRGGQAVPTSDCFTSRSMSRRQVASTALNLRPSLGICCWMSSLPKMGSRYSQPCWHLNHSSKISCRHKTRKITITELGNRYVDAGYRTPGWHLSHQEHHVSIQRMMLVARVSVAPAHASAHHHGDTVHTACGVRRLAAPESC
jgi:hypothetical protein